MTTTRIRALIFTTFIFYCLNINSASAQSLLETFVFMHNNGWINIEDLKETPDGKLVEPSSPYITKGSQNTWSVVDRDNCVLKDDTPGLQLSTTYYLNNIIPGFKTDMPRQNVYRLTMYGDKPVTCTNERGNAACRRELILEATNDFILLRFRKAVDYIFTKYCRFAQPAKPF